MESVTRLFVFAIEDGFVREVALLYDFLIKHIHVPNKQLVRSQLSRSFPVLKDDPADAFSKGD